MGIPQMDREFFGTAATGERVERFTLYGPHGMSARLISFGATVTELLVPDSEGRLADVVLGFDDLASYETKSPYFGCTVGRVAFRIPYGRFELDGQRYQLSLNRGPHHLHGGARGFSWRVWKADEVPSGSDQAIEFTLVSADGDEGYPGQLHAAVRYTLTQAGELRIDFRATTDRATPVNMTHHGYFNLAGAGTRDVLQHRLQIDADQYSETDAQTIPTGALPPVAGTPLDFRQATPIGQRIGTSAGQLSGYDLAYLHRHGSGELARVATLHDPGSGRKMDVLTDAPALILYTGNDLDGTLQGKHGYAYTRHRGVCLETGHLPDSVHHANFPSAIVRPQGEYRHTCVYRFSSDAGS